MKKIIIIGSPGAGKSYFAKQLAFFLNIPLYHLDNLYWRADKTHIEHEELVEKIQKIIEEETWIIDGNYHNTMELRVKEADTIFFFDLPTETCLEGITSRVGKERDDIPWVEESVNPEFLRFVEGFKKESRPRIDTILNQYSDDKCIYRFYRREETNKYIFGLIPKKNQGLCRWSGYKTDYRES